VVGVALGGVVPAVGVETEEEGDVLVFLLATPVILKYTPRKRS
jgi:hypothetical protein